MKHIRNCVAALVVLGLSLGVWAQNQRSIRNYNPATETTVKGTVEDVQQQTGRRGRSGIHLVLNTESGSIAVHVGPSAYVSEKQFSFAKGDKIEILGSKVSINGTDTVIAREINKEGKTLVLRNAQGIPEWAGPVRKN